MKKRPADISKDDWNAVNSPPLPDKMIALMEPARGGRGKQKTLTKVSTTLRLDADVIEHFKRGGKGWQTRINRALRKLIPV